MEEIGDALHELAKSPSMHSDMTGPPFSPDSKTEDGVDRISVQSEKNTDPNRLGVASPTVVLMLSSYHHRHHCFCFVYF